ncbi:MarR family transcriptional regulator [Paenibacillus rigui]|uniref:MarR family transcriptional regulator n=1 Tax=Paenibacillus rigui TaxID=554312 RepID=UPI0015C607C3|nr:MarR family transcriptional regulator [Paenibacillus rigui]
MGHLEDKLNEFEQLVQTAMCQTNKWTAPAQTISKQQFLLMLILRNNRRMTLSELAEELYLSPSATTIAVNRLVRDGHIQRTRDEADRRVVWVQLTEKAEELVNQLRARRRSILLGMFSNLSDEEIDQFLVITSKMLSHLKDPD